MTSPSGLEEGEGLSQGWYRWLERVIPGSISFPVPSAVSALEGWLAVVQPQAIILTGGEDVGTNPPRDAAEGYLLNEFYGRIPILGVCRGAQLINSWRGGHVLRDASAQHAGTRHELRIRSSVLGLGQNIWRTMTVNSYHSNCIAEADLGDGLSPLALHDDGTVEAFQDPSGGLLAIMWHPERERVSNLDVDLWLARHLTGESSA